MSNIQTSVKMRKAITDTQRKYVYNKTNGHCAYCGYNIDYQEMTIDHIKPLSLGGTNDNSNLLPACDRCNQIKGTYRLRTFRKIHAANNNGDGSFYYERLELQKEDTNQSVNSKVKVDEIEYIVDNLKRILCNGWGSVLRTEDEMLALKKAIKYIEVCVEYN